MLFNCPAFGADLPALIRAALSDKVMAKADVGIAVVRLGTTPQMIYQQNADVLMTPASNLKLFTTSAALDRLGPEFKFKTRLLVKPVPGTGEVDAVIVGDGDPSFGDAELLKKFNWDVDTVYKTWAAKLKERGYTKVRNVVIDDSVFDQDFVHPDWPTDQLHKRYVAGVGGMNLNANCIDFYIAPGVVGERVSFTPVPDTKYAPVDNTCVYGNESAIWLSRAAAYDRIILKGVARRGGTTLPVSVTVMDPPMFAAQVFSETLAASGVTMSGRVVRDRSFRPFVDRNQLGLISTTVVAIHETPLEQVLARANKDSMNLYAESLCKRLGFAASGEGTWATGTREMGAFLQKVGVPATSFRLVDGSGLSKTNKVTAGAIVKVLAHDFAGPNKKLYLGTLAIAGVDGTISDQFRGTDLKGRVFAKSGYVSGVSCLSGYLHASDDQWYAFSVLINNITGGGKEIRERVVKAVDDYTKESAR